MKVLRAAVLFGAVAVAVLPGGIAAAATPSVSATPGANIPYVTSTNSYVRKLAQCGSTMYAVGTFSTVGAAGKPTLTRHNVLAFNATTGAISSWDPNTNGEVNSIAFTDDSATAYLGGSFSSVHGT